MMINRNTYSMHAVEYSVDETMAHQACTGNSENVNQNLHNAIKR